MYFEIIVNFHAQVISILRGACLVLKNYIAIITVSLVFENWISIINLSIV